MHSADFSSGDDIQRNLLRVMAVTSGSWNLVASSRIGRRLASRNPRPAPRHGFVLPRQAHAVHALLPWAW